MPPEEEFWGGSVAFLTSICALSIYLWDLGSTTFVSERQFIWRTRFAKENLLYYWTRFYGLAGLFIYLFIPQGLGNSTVCMKRHSVRYALIQFGMSTAQLWTLKQTFFLFNRSRRMLVSIFFTVAVSAMLQSYGMVLYFRHLGYSQDCQRVSDRPVGIVVWTVGTVSMQAVVFTTSLFKLIKGIRSGISTAPSYVNYIVARDNVATSLFILTVYTSATIVRSKYGVGENIWNFAWAWVFALLNIATYRMVLNYREARLISLSYYPSAHDSFTITEPGPLSTNDSDPGNNTSETSSTLSADGSMTETKPRTSESIGDDRNKEQQGGSIED